MQVSYYVARFSPYHVRKKEITEDVPSLLEHLVI
jgi:hypothetical protein